MIDRFSFSQDPLSFRDINLAHKYPMNQGVNGTNLGTNPTFVYNMVMSEVISIIPQAADNSILTRLHH